MSASLDQYEVLEELGSGTFGTVSRLRRKADGKIMVWKQINFGRMNEKEKSQLVTEVNVLNDLKSPFVVRYHDRIVDKANTKLYIVMEYCPNKDLAKVIERSIRSKSNIDEPLIWKIFAQCVLGLKDCHRRRETSGEFKPIIHRDIKPANIMLDANNNVKMGDFGLAKELSSRSKLAQTNVGTPYYMAPEIMNEKDYDEKADIWSLGCVLYELAALKPPFHATNAVALAAKINTGVFSRLPSKYSDALQNAIKSMIQVSPRLRPRVEDLEVLPAMQTAMDRAKLIAERNLWASQVEEDRLKLYKKQEALVAKEAALKAFEASLKEKEGQLQQMAELIKQQAASLGVAVPAGAAPVPVAATAPAAAAVHVPLTRARSRLSMDRTTELMSIDEEEEAPPASAMLPPAPRGPVPMPETRVPLQTVSVNIAQPTFKIHTDDSFKKNYQEAAKVLQPMPTAAFIGQAKPTAPFPSGFNRRNGPIVTGAENAKENVYFGVMPPPPPPAAPVVAVPAAVPRVAAVAPAAMHHAYRRPLDAETRENTVGSPWKKQRAATAAAAAPPTVDPSALRRGLQPAAFTHRAYGINQQVAPVYEFGVKAQVGGGMLKNPSAGYQPPATVQVDLHTLLRQNGAV